MTGILPWNPCISIVFGRQYEECQIIWIWGKWDFPQRVKPWYECVDMQSSSCSTSIFPSSSLSLENDLCDVIPWFYALWVPVGFSQWMVLVGDQIWGGWDWGVWHPLYIHLTWLHLTTKGYVFLQWADPCEELVESLMSSSSDDSLSLPSLSLGVLSSPVN